MCRVLGRVQQYFFLDQDTFFSSNFVSLWKGVCLMTFVIYFALFPNAMLCVGSDVFCESVGDISIEERIKCSKKENQKKNYPANTELCVVVGFFSLRWPKMCARVRAVRLVDQMNCCFFTLILLWACLMFVIFVTEALISRCALALIPRIMYFIVYELSKNEW